MIRVPIAGLALTALLANPCQTRAQSPAQGDWQFDDITDTLDLDWSFELSGNRLEGRDRMAGGLAAADIDRDGWVDLYIPRGDRKPGLLLRNLGNGLFQDVAEQWDLTVSSDVPMSYANGAAFGDITGNGFPDLILGGIREFGLRLFLNDGKRFRRAEPSWGLGIDKQDQYSVTLADINGDARLDLAVGHWKLSEPHGSRGGHLWLQTDAGFVDASGKWGVIDAFMSRDFSFTPNFADITGDGRPDLLIAADFGTSKVFHNIEGSRFQDVTSPVIDDENGMGAAVADFDGDGNPDWFVTSIWSKVHEPETGSGFSGNRLYRNNGAGHFDDLTDFAGVRQGQWGWGACAMDFDNSGTTDLFHVNGFLSDNRQASRLFMNTGGARFVEAAVDHGIADQGQGRGIVCFDYDRDGDIDVFIQNNGQAGRAYRNSASENGNHWLGIRLRDDSLNTEAIGARIEVTAGNRRQVRELTIPNHFLSTSPAELHLGLGGSALVERVEISWPDGTLEVYTNVAPDQWLTFHKGCGSMDRTGSASRRMALARGNCLQGPGPRESQRQKLLWRRLLNDQ